MDLFSDIHVCTVDWGHDLSLPYCIGKLGHIHTHTGANQFSEIDHCPSLVISLRMRIKESNQQSRPTQTEQYKHKSRIEDWNFGFKKYENCTIHVAKTQALISFAVLAKLICVFVFAYANCWSCHDAPQIMKRESKRLAI